jgi:ADP-ribosylglycohydrolase
MKGTPVTNLDLTGFTYRDKVRGCWVGKNCGGTLGTPLEEALGRPEPFDVWWYPELREGGLPNDDLEMQLVWLTALEQVGPDLKARDLARYWLDHIGYNWDEYGLSKTNLRLGLEPPVSGHYNNWFIDCMGSPIRSEVWACVAPGVPRLAAKYAYEDAICDHAGGESVYGELFNVAVQSAAFVVGDPQKLIDIGLSYVPEHSRTAAAVHAAVAAHRDGLDWKQARQRVLEATPSHVAQYSPINMGFQVIGLLYGDDFGDAMCKTVNCGYDTDSSGGTIGSWLGIVAGSSNLPQKWTEPFGDAISTNESWGGVRHLSDGTTPIPSTLPEVVDRVVAAARRLLGSFGLVGEDGTLEIRDEDLYADDSIRALWDRNPLLVEIPAIGTPVAVDYVDTPAVVPGSTKRVITRLRNHHPDPISGVARLIVPDGWDAVPPRTVAIEAAGEAVLAWDIPIPGRDRLDNSNRLFVDFRPDGYPQEPAVPIVLVGARATRVSGPYPANGSDATAMLDTIYPPEDMRFPTEWHDIDVLENGLPLGDLLTAPGVLYVQTYFEAASAMDAFLGVDTSSPSMAWLNGEPLFSVDRYRPVRPAYGSPNDGYQNVSLAAGFNELLIKIVRGTEPEPPQCHILLSTADRLHHGLPQVGRTRYPA